MISRVLGRNGSQVTFVFAQMLRHSIRYVPKTWAFNQDDDKGNGRNYFMSCLVS